MSADSFHRSHQDAIERDAARARAGFADALTDGTDEYAAKAAVGAETGLLVVYGASDDLIEVDGLLSDELNPSYGKPAVVSIRVDDAAYASLHVEYDPDGTGEWRIQPTSLGSLVTIVPARGEDQADDEDGCPGHSDKAVIDMAGIEARRIDISVLPPTEPGATS